MKGRHHIQFICTLVAASSAVVAVVWWCHLRIKEGAVAAAKPNIIDCACLKKHMIASDSTTTR
jgi:hypothetical protein